MSEVILHCPLCPKDKTPKLYVNVDKDVFNCFRCGFRGPLFLLAKYPDLYAKLEIKASMAALHKAREYFLDPKHQNSEIFKELAPVRPVSTEDPQYGYLLSRGWTEYMFNAYSPLVSTHKRFANRVILPVFSDDGDLLYFTARSLDPGAKLKYLNAKVSKAGVFFKSKMSESVLFEDTLVICEGIFDSAKVPASIALLGKILLKDSEKTLIDLVKHKKNVYVCLDTGAESDSTKLAKTLLSWFPNKTIYIIDTDAYNEKDLGSLSEVLSPIELMDFIRRNSSIYTPSFLMDKLKHSFQKVGVTNHN